MATRRSFFIGIVFALVCVVGVSVVAIAADGAFQKNGSASSAPTVNGADIAVFKAAVKASDHAPSSVVAAALSLNDGSTTVASSLRPGSILMGQSRMLVADRSGSAKIFGFPSDRGKLCYVVVEGPVGCEDEVGGSHPSWGIYDPDAVGDGEPASVYGFVADKARNVNVVVDGVSTSAKLGRNAYYLQLPAATSIASLIEIVYRDGSTESIPLPPPPTP